MALLLTTRAHSRRADVTYIQVVVLCPVIRAVACNKDRLFHTDTSPGFAKAPESWAAQTKAAWHPTLQTQSVQASVAQPNTWVHRFGYTGLGSLHHSHCTCCLEYKLLVWFYVGSNTNIMVCIVWTVICVVAWNRHSNPKICNIIYVCSIIDRPQDMNNMQHSCCNAWTVYRLDALCQIFVSQQSIYTGSHFHFMKSSNAACIDMLCTAGKHPVPWF